MDRSATLILPEGFLTNTKEIYQEVASYSVIPPEQLWQYWHVYTTTFRKLVDPTAYRLENFWWHVMGSDRRHLSGKALAKIFEEISTGPSFVPLRRPDYATQNPPIPKPSQDEVQREDGASAGTRPRPTPGQAQGRGSNSSKSGSDKITMKEPTSSSSRPPPPHPILKKSRGPSSSGPRPTARFVSPHDSEEESLKDAETSSESTAGIGMAMRSRPAPHTTKAEKRLTPTGKKRVVATSASRRRPALPRRQSSQSSGASDTNTKATAESRSSAGSKAGSVEYTTAGSQASSGDSTLVNSPVLSSRAAGKRPMRGSPEKDRSSLANGSPKKEVLGRPALPVQPPTAFSRTAPDLIRNSPTPSYESSRLRYEVSREPARPMSGSLTSARLQPQTQRPGASMMMRSQSNIETPRHRPREASLGRALPHNLLAPIDKAMPSNVSVSNVAVQVQFDSASVTPVGSGSEARDIPDSVTLPSRSSSASLFTPTQASPSPSIHLGRSKSQLTLLLERDKDRVGDMQAKTKTSKSKNGK